MGVSVRGRSARVAHRMCTHAPRWHDTKSEERNRRWHWLRDEKSANVIPMLCPLRVAEFLLSEAKHDAEEQPTESPLQHWMHLAHETHRASHATHARCCRSKRSWHHGCCEVANVDVDERAPCVVAEVQVHASPRQIEARQKDREEATFEEEAWEGKEEGG